jgi:prepilin-type N-terminal cleavage/methylation domain-containing protein
VGTKRQGFTLIELILVCALLVLIAAIVLPSFEDFYADARANAGADMVRGRLAEAQSRAVEEGRAYRFEVLEATKCRVVPDSGAPAPSSGGSSGSGGDADAEDTLPQKVSFDLGSEGNLLKVVFLPDGSASSDAEVRITSPGARPVVLRLRALTGTITTVRLLPEGNQP